MSQPPITTPPPQRRAAILVEVWAIGQPGRVGITVATTGTAPDRLKPAAVARTLRSAADYIEKHPEMLAEMLGVLDL